MDYKYIEQLLERYWQCETTLEEEQILRTFFSQEDVPSHLKQYAELFIYENEATDQCLSDDFKQRMVDVVCEDTEVEARIIPLTSRISSFLKAAAVVAVTLTIGNVAERALQKNSVSEVPGAPVIADTYTRTEDITSTIHIIDRNQHDAMAQADSIRKLDAIVEEGL